MKNYKIKKILVPLDFSPTSLNALNNAVELARHTDAELHLLHVVENLYATTDPLFAAEQRVLTYENDLNVLSNELLIKAAESIPKKGDLKVNIISAVGRTHKEILQTSKNIQADIIIMGTHGVSGFREFAMGSNTYRVVSDSHLPVLSIHTDHTKPDFKNILLPFSDRPHSRDTVLYAIKIAALYNSTLNVLGIDDGDTEAHRIKIERETEQIKSIVEEDGVKCVSTVINAPYEVKTVLNHAKAIHADLILTIGDEPRQNITEFFTGSFASQLINHSTIPVLSVHSKFNPKMVELWHAL